MTETIYDWSINTKCIHGNKEKKRNGVIANSVTPAVAYAFENTEEAASVVSGARGGIYYGRYGNPTTNNLEAQIALLENGEAALGLSSGMAAISSAILANVKHGEHVLVTKHIYGGTYKFLSTLGPRFGITYDYVDCTDLTMVKQAIRPETRVLFIETPSNPCLTVLDINKLSTLAHEHGLIVVVDNTLMTPLLQKPLELGADIVVHSATKYLNGHGDVLAGFIISNQQQIEYIRKNMMGDLGQHLNAWDSYLILRGLKTLPIRMKHHCDSAQEIANYLEQHPYISSVYFPGSTTHPQYQLVKEQMNGCGGIVSFEVKGGFEEAKKFIDRLELCMISFSLGDPETLVQHPASMTHFAIPKHERASFGITDGLIRLSTGLEDKRDILFDIEQALMR
ncbi:aminotransferase class I/II-fold pyridoxal phosphate-dependent enzyme [Cytobacillus sp. IB215665]|uniref:trans-sulfuration enzyme family protein n=1 Tax=Cytobacillus sp. IB215665 TaxID=3097357 RepID=UPI002A154A92|nr:aminotransferase class I/II-fold pyridoxal phosphate-dependent enzyme [Cytobacillus sp. IB215665]MDX8366818.1 aminotransferase class I/II-fold pyridoxal phosphate-dependent enzyme [Cytobacillus sp. IB215665]